MHPSFVKRFTELYQAHRDRLYRKARNLGLDPEDAEDVVQTVFARVWNGGERILAKSLSPAYFDTACKHASLDQLAKIKAAATLRARVEVQCTSAETPEVELIRRELESHVQREVLRLPRRCREVVSLCYLKGLSTAEASAVLGVREKSVEKARARARRILRTRLPQLEASRNNSRPDGGEKPLIRLLLAVGQY